MRNPQEPNRTSSTDSHPNDETETQGDRFGSAQVPNRTESPEPMGSEAIRGLAHDLRTPFVSIRGYTRMVLEERVGPINSTQREYLTIVAENVDKVIRLLNELLK